MQTATKTLDTQVEIRPTQYPADTRFILLHLIDAVCGLYNAYLNDVLARNQYVLDKLNKLPKYVQKQRLLETAAYYDNGELLVYQSQALTNKPQLDEGLGGHQPTGGIFRYRIQDGKRQLIGNFSHQQLKRNAPPELRGMSDVLDGYIYGGYTYKKVHTARTEPWHPFYWSKHQRFTRLQKAGLTSSFDELIARYTEPLPLVDGDACCARWQRDIMRGQQTAFAFFNDGSTSSHIAFEALLSLERAINAYLVEDDHDRSAKALADLISTSQEIAAFFLRVLEAPIYKPDLIMKPFYDLLSLQHAGTLKKDNRKIRYMSEELIRKDGSPANGIALFRSF